MGPHFRLLPRFAGEESLLPDETPSLRRRAVKPHFFVLSIVLLVACAPVPQLTPSPAPPPTSPPPDYEPLFETVSCSTAGFADSLRGSDYNLECGYLVVPEDRSQPEGNQVRMPVVVFRTPSSDPKPDPVIYLAKGWNDV